MLTKRVMFLANRWLGSRRSYRFSPDETAPDTLVHGEGQVSKGGFWLARRQQKATQHARKLVMRTIANQQSGIRAL